MRPHALRHTALGFALWMVAGSGALAFGPTDVVDGTPPSERALRQAAALARAEAALAASTAGTSARLKVGPALAYGADLEDPAALSATATVDLKLGWRDDRAAVLKDTADVLAEREDLRGARRRDVLAALRLYGSLLRAEVALRRAELDLAARAPGSVAAARARLLAQRRRHRIDDLRAEARRLGFVDDARFVPVTFLLPEAGSEPSEAERLRLDLALAELEQDGAVFDVLRDVSLDASYESRTDGYEIAASIGLDRGRPAALLSGQLGPQQDDQWSLSLTADLVLDGNGQTDRLAAAERVRRAQAALDAALAQHPARLRRARTSVDDARAVLALELDAWRTATEAAQATLASEDEAARRRVCRDLLTRENATYGAWLDLVSATFAYLEASDGGWHVTAGPQPPPARPAACTASAVGG